MRHCLCLALSALLALSGCAPTVPGNQVAEDVLPMFAARELPESELLNVSLRVLEPGVLPQDPDDRRGLSAEIREAEARFVPIHLKYTLQRTGFWGAVRVVPDDDVGTDLLVSGRIEYSDGESGAVRVRAVDARNKVWFEKVYAETVDSEAHNGVQPQERDAFQDLFNTIANDLVRYRNRLSPEEVGRIKEVAEMRYAKSVAPESFAGYLEQDGQGGFDLLRLPAADDPMLARIRALRVRDDLLVDAINGYYDSYYQDLWEPYANWRRFRSEEVAAMRKIEREALAKQVLGVAAIVGAIVIGAAADSKTRSRTGTLRDVMVMGGAAAVYSGYQNWQETDINQSAIEELGESFKTEAEPLTLEVDGETVRLTGSAEQQYAHWRDLLRQIYARETGFSEDASEDASEGAPANPVPYEYTEKDIP